MTAYQTRYNYYTEQTVKDDISDRFTNVPLNSFFSSLRTDCFMVWRFEQAPQWMQYALSDNGGDEDWITIVHKDAYDATADFWIDKTGCCSRNTYEIDNWLIWVGCHA